MGKVLNLMFFVALALHRNVIYSLSLLNVKLVVYFFIVATCVMHEQFIQTRNKLNTQPLGVYKSLHLQNCSVCLN